VQSYSPAQEEGLLLAQVRHRLLAFAMIKNHFLLLCKIRTSPRAGARPIVAYNLDLLLMYQIMEVIPKQGFHHKLCSFGILEQIGQADRAGGPGAKSWLCRYAALFAGIHFVDAILQCACDLCHYMSASLCCCV
jgi:hypothetical protein